MPKLWLTEQEQDLLIFNERFPAWYTVLYLYIKSHMDFETGITGIKRSINYKGMMEHCEYKPMRRSTSTQFTPTMLSLHLRKKV